MASKPKVRRVPKVSSATPAHPKPPKQDRPKSAEALIKYNGELVEQLFAHEAWIDIAFPLLEEMRCGVSGRFTNGRYYHGSLTRDTSLNTGLYAKSLMDFYNNLKDFIESKDKLDKDRREKVADKNAPVYNPFMEEEE